ncbi:hypothetical protein EGW08_018971, partial [Elysia chlorotica]
MDQQRTSASVKGLGETEGGRGKRRSGRSGHHKNRDRGRSNSSSSSSSSRSRSKSSSSSDSSNRSKSDSGRKKKHRNTKTNKTKSSKDNVKPNKNPVKENGVAKNDNNNNTAASTKNDNSNNNNNNNTTNSRTTESAKIYGRPLTCSARLERNTNGYDNSDRNPNRRNLGSSTDRVAGERAIFGPWRAPDPERQRLLVERLAPAKPPAPPDPRFNHWKNHFLYYWHIGSEPKPRREANYSASPRLQQHCEVGRTSAHSHSSYNNRRLLKRPKTTAGRIGRDHNSSSSSSNNNNNNNNNNN